MARTESDNEEQRPEVRVVDSLGPVYANGQKQILTGDDTLYYSKAGAWVAISGGGGAPSAHKDTHKSGGSDAFTSADLLEAVVKRLLESGAATTLLIGAIADGEFLKRVGTSIVGASPAAGSAAITQVEVDFGSAPASEKNFLITDAAVDPSSKIIATGAYAAPTGKDADEMEMDPLSIICLAGSGEFTMNVRALKGRVIGAFVVNYLVG